MILDSWKSTDFACDVIIVGSALFMEVITSYPKNAYFTDLVPGGLTQLPCR